MTTTSDRAGARAIARGADGYLPIEGYALIGNGRSVALVGIDGAIDWCTFPRIDAASIFNRILDSRIGGYWQLAPVGPARIERHYHDDTNVLVTTFHTDDGSVEVVDLMPSAAFASELGVAQALWDGVLLRVVRGVAGTVRMGYALRPGFDHARAHASFEPIDGRGVLVCSHDAAIRVVARVPLEIVDGAIRTTFEIGAGERHAFAVSYHDSGTPIWEAFPHALVPEMLERDIGGWERWIARCSYDGPRAEFVRRSALVLKLLDYLPSGAMAAAATTSLPEKIGGERNWDYRYAWIRDTSYALHALHSIGFRDEAQGFLQWVIDVTRDDPADLHIMYQVDGGTDLEERTLDHLEGYRGSRPVRIGNGAFHQRQLDRYGEVVDAAWVHRAFGGVVNGTLWEYIREIVALVGHSWRLPDAGIWEVRSEPRRMTYSNVMCWVAVDRAIRLAECDGRDAPLDDWRALRDEIHAEVMTQGVRDGVFSQGFGDDVLDASALTFPLRGFIPVDHPVARATIEAIERELTRDGLVARYALADAAGRHNVDGLAGDEGHFVLCSFWLIDCLIGLGELDRAETMLDAMLARANDVGLFSEEIDGRTGAFLGNMPQAFSHVGVINSIVNLARARGGWQHLPARREGQVTGSAPSD